MMSTIYFYDNLVALAKSLIDAKSSFDDIKAGEDLAQIKSIVNHAIPSQGFIRAANQLHEKLQEDYKEIDKMHISASQMKRAVGVYYRNNQSEYEEVLSKLESDCYGIYASVLLKHGVISQIKEFIEKVE